MYVYGLGCDQLAGPNMGQILQGWGKAAAGIILQAKGAPGAAELVAEGKALMANARPTPRESQKLWANMLQRSEREAAEKKAALIKAQNELALQEQNQVAIADAAADQAELRASLLPGVSNKTLVWGALAVGAVFLFSDLMKPRRASR